MPDYITIQCDNCHVEEIELPEDARFIDLINKNWFLLTKKIRNTTALASLCPHCNKGILDTEIRTLPFITKD